MTWWQIFLTIVISYMIGNISWGRIISKTQNQDITKLGSGNPGSTNVLRNSGFKLGLITLIFDILKGFIPSIAAFYIFGSSYIMLYVAGFSTIIGHIFPVIFLFKGGKGIATMLGMFFAAAPLTTAIVCLIGFFCWLSFEYGSVSSFWCVTALTVSQGLRVKKYLPELDAKIICLILFFTFLITWYAHRGNIQRLLVGRESKVNLLRATKRK